MSTPKQLAEKIGIEYHQQHVHNLERIGDWASWNAFLVCTHEICEDSRELIKHLEMTETSSEYWERSAGEWERLYNNMKERLTHVN